MTAEWEEEKGIRQIERQSVSLSLSLFPFLSLTVTLILTPVLSKSNKVIKPLALVEVKISLWWVLWHLKVVVFSRTWLYEDVLQQNHDFMKRFFTRHWQYCLLQTMFVQSFRSKQGHTTPQKHRDFERESKPFLLNHIIEISKNKQSSFALYLLSYFCSLCICDSLGDWSSRCWSKLMSSE